MCRRQEELEEICRCSYVVGKLRVKTDGSKKYGSSDTASSMGPVCVNVASLTSTLVVVSVRRRRPRRVPAGTTTVASCRRRTPLSRLHPVPRARTASLRRVHAAGGLDARPRRRLPAVARPRPVSRHLGVGERHAAVGSRWRRLDVQSLFEQTRSFLQL